MLGRSRFAGDVSRDGMQQMMRDLFASPDVSLEPIDVLAGDGHAAAVVRYDVTGSGQTYRGLRTVLYRIGDGKIHELWIFDEDQRAFDEIVDASSR